MNLLLNVDAVARKLGVSVPLVWKIARTDDTFPKAVNLSKRVTRWIESDIEAWVLTKKQGENHEIRRTDREVHQGPGSQGDAEEGV